MYISSGKFSKQLHYKKIVETQPISLLLNPKKHILHLPGHYSNQYTRCDRQ